MAWFDEFNLPGATIDGYFGFIQADGPDDDDYPDVVLANGTVTFTATTEAARIGGAWLGIQPVTAQIFEGQIVISEEDPRPVRLLATDAPIGVADWAWRATFNVPGVKFEPLTFKAPQGTTVNLTADLIPIKSSPYQVVKGDSIVDAEADATGRLRFEISNGSFTNWVAVPVGPHTHDLEDVTGLQAALDGKTDTTDPRLSDARPPITHEHEISDVTGLAARLDALEAQIASIAQESGGDPEA